MPAILNLSSGVVYLQSVNLNATGTFTINSGQLDVAAGMASAPSIAAATQTNTGLYFSSTTAMRFASTGTDTVELNANGVKIVNNTGGIYIRNAGNTADIGPFGVVSHVRATAVSSAQTLATFTPASDTTVILCSEVEITTLGSGSFNIKANWTDPAGNVKAMTQLVQQDSATSLVTACNAAANFVSAPQIVRVKGGTTVTTTTSGTFTGCTYNASGIIIAISN